ncbi:MAG: iron-sulfur cluster assembly protein [Planctomycetota bacterium]
MSEFPAPPGVPAPPEPASPIAPSAPPPAAPVPPAAPPSSPLPAAELDRIRKQIDVELKSCYDPEIPVNVQDLGLVYALDVAPDGSITITMTLTAPGCPLADLIVEQVRSRLASIPGVPSAGVKLTWDPPWTPERMSAAAKLQLGW